MRFSEETLSRRNERGVEMLDLVRGSNKAFQLVSFVRVCLTFAPKRAGCP